jgi:hypothetical protein
MGDCHSCYPQSIMGAALVLYAVIGRFSGRLGTLFQGRNEVCMQRGVGGSVPSEPLSL